MKENNVDGEFLDFLLKKLEEGGEDIDKPTHKIPIDRVNLHIRHIYSQREFFEAMKRGEYWPTVFYSLIMSIASREEFQGYYKNKK